MNDYRINVRFHSDVPGERKAAEYLQSLKKSRNRFIVGAVIDAINREATGNESLLEQIRQVFRDELSEVSFVAPAPTEYRKADTVLTEEQQAENDENVLADLELFG